MDISYYKKYEPVFNYWHIVREIGEGSYGKVFEIERKELGHVYKSALKALSLPQSKQELDNVRAVCGDGQGAAEYYRDFMEKMAAEFELMSKLRGHSNIVSYEDHAVYPQENGIGWDIFIRMELLTPLIKHASDNAMQEKDIIKLGIDICKALELCRKHNIIHRDIKPENIFVSENGDFKLGDFGIAKTVEKTMGGLSQKGTFAYMAPEVYKNKAYGPGVDIYSLGIVLYRYLNNNRAPFYPDYPTPVMFSDGENALNRRMSGEAIPPLKNISPELSAIILKACAFNPENRFSTPAEMRRALESVLGIDSGISVSSTAFSSVGDGDATTGIFSSRNTNEASNAFIRENARTVVSPTPGQQHAQAAETSDASMRVCPDCGTHYTSYEEFCPRCRKPLKEPSVSALTAKVESSAETRASAKKLITVILLLAGAAILAFCIYLAISKTDPPQDDNEYYPSEAPTESEPLSTAAPQTDEPISTSVIHKPKELTPEEREKICQSIKERFYSTQEILDSCDTVSFDDGTKGYYNGDALVVLRDGPDSSLDYDKYDFPNDDLTCFTGLYYFDRDVYEVYFVYLYNPANGNEYRLYFNEGNLVRWIGPDGEIHDSRDEAWDMMQALYDYAFAHCREADLSRYAE